jgi:mono/diheme cytochrome c family protein
MTAVMMQAMRWWRMRRIIAQGDSTRQSVSILAGGVVSIVAGGIVLALLSGCDVERRKSDAELGLNSQQAAGRKIYDTECDRCHEPYSSKGKKGPGLKGVFQRQYLPLSGLPANDERVTDIIRSGRNEMPGYSQKLSQQELQDLLVYMHTL